MAESVCACVCAFWSLPASGSNLPDNEFSLKINIFVNIVFANYFTILCVTDRTLLFNYLRDFCLTPSAFVNLLLLKLETVLKWPLWWVSPLLNWTE